MKRKNLLSMVLGLCSPAEVLGSRASLCNAQYDDEDVGYDPQGYNTAGGDGDPVYDNAGNVVGQMQFRPMAAARPGGGLQLARPAARPAPMRPAAARPAAQPLARPAQGLTLAQVEQIARQQSLSQAQVRAIVQEMLAQMSPYGAIPPRPNLDEAMFPMGLGFVVLSGGPPSVLTAGFPGILPQRSFRGERLVLSTLRSAGATTVPVIVDTFKVGDYSQLVGGGSVPVETFAPDSFGVRLMLDGAVPGVTYTLNVSVPAAIGIPAGETITVVGTVIGRAGEAPQR